MKNKKSERSQNGGLFVYISVGRKLMGKKRLELLGQKFGKLTVIESLGVENSSTSWLCKCACGNIIRAKGSKLTSGKSHCGCSTSKGKRLDLQGKKFGKLTVITFVETDKNNAAVWLCKCDCGGERKVISSALTGSLITHCGCDREKSRHNPINKPIRIFNTNKPSPVCTFKQSPIYRRMVSLKEYTNFIENINNRDNFQCRVCNRTSSSMSLRYLGGMVNILTVLDVNSPNVNTLVHQEKMEALWHINNGITLCEECFHSSEVTTDFLKEIIKKGSE